MSYLALYRKYRPKDFDEVVGQEYVVKILKNSIKSNRFSHAYLFSGPRGTGKTSFAKIIAKIINCDNRKGTEVCNNCPSCSAYLEKNHPDIIELDAASNNGVAEIRIIRDKISLMPSISKYKVYIIDEVHMLSNEAFNALLKTLEEPPQHVVFILATTEFYKVPETIVSRCQCFDFEKISEKNIIKKLEEIVKKEDIEIEDSVLSLIARWSNGGLRDAINMLDKLVCCFDKIKEKDFYEISGLTSIDDLKQIYKIIEERNIKTLFKTIEELNEKGKNLILFTEELMNYIKDILFGTMKDNVKTEIPKEKLFLIVDILRNVIMEMKQSTYVKTTLEIGMLRIVSIIDDDVFENRQTNKEQSEKKIEIEDIKQKDEKIKTKKKQESKLMALIEKNRKIRINNAFTTANKKILSDLKIRWVNLTEYLNNKEFSAVVSYIIDGNIMVAGEKDIIISVAYESILENALFNLQKIEKLLETALNCKYNIAFILDSEWAELKRKYIEDKNNGIVYKYKIEEPINYDDFKEEIAQKKSSEIAEDAISLFGKDLIEIK